MSTLRYRLGGLIALLAIVGIVVGLPMALLAVGANPLEAGLPSLDDVRSTLTSPDDGTVLLALVKVVAWGAWAFLTVAILLEAVARLRGVRAPQFPGMRLPQKAARGLVGAAAALFVAVPMAGAASAATVPATPPAASAPVVAAADVAAGQSAATTTGPATAATAASSSQQAQQEPTAPATVQHTVRRGETLWSIAQSSLGDGHRYREIVELNPSLLGGRADFLKAGWVLTVPAPVDHTAAGQVVVERGDTLSEIALEELGDASRYLEVFEASRRLVQPGGARLSDPDVIDVGWTLQLPDTAAPAPAAEQQAAPAPPPVQQPPTDPSAAHDSARGQSGAQGGNESGAQDEDAAAPAAPPASQPAAPQQAPPAPAPALTSTPSATATPSADADASRQDVPATSQAASDGLEEDSDWMVATGVGVGALLAAGVLTLVGTRRRAQQRRRRPGQRLPMPTGATAQVEQELRATADALSVEVVDVALRRLARDCAAAGTALPVVRAARLTASQFDLYLAEPTQLPAPWTSTADATVGTLDVEAAGDLQDVDVSGVPAPYPALVVIGHDDEDGHVFLDLEHLGALGVAGESLSTREVLAALAVELATSSWADDLQVTVVGAFAELEDALQTGRIRYLPSVSRVLDELSHRAAEDRRALAAAGVPDLHTARVSAAAPDAWAPEIVLLAGELTDRQRTQLEQLVEAVPRVAIAVVTAGIQVGEWGVDLTAGDSPEFAVLRPINLQLRPQRLPAEQYGHLLELASLSDPDELDGDAQPEPTLADVDAVTPLDDPAADAPASEAPESVEALGEAAAREDDVTSRLAGVTRADLAEEAAAARPAVIDVRTTAAAEGTTSPAYLPIGGVFLPDSARITADAADEDVRPDPVDGQPAAPRAEDNTTAAAATPSTDTADPVPGATAAIAPRILVLGPVDLVNAAGTVEPTKRARLLEYAAYLALYPGATHSAIDDAIWPDRKTDDNLNTRNTATSKLRKWAGLNPEGEEYLPRHQAGEGYAFLPAVTTDAGDWAALLGGDPLNAGTENLEAALRLVRGIPFQGTHRRRYAWADPFKHRLISEIVDASYELGRRRLMEGRWRAAEQALVVGLRIEPAQETLWRLRILAAHESRNPNAETEAVERLLAITEELDCGLEDETEQLLTALKRPGADLAKLMASASAR